MDWRNGLWNGLYIIPIGFLLKNSTRKFYPCKIKFLSHFDKTICSIKILRSSLESTKDIKGDLINYLSPPLNHIS